MVYDAGSIDKQLPIHTALSQTYHMMMMTVMMNCTCHIHVSVENVKAKTAEILNSLTEHDLRNCLEHWQHRMQLCVNSEGNYFEGDPSLFPEFVK